MAITIKGKEKKLIYAELILLVILGMSQYFGMTVVNLAIVFALIGLYMLLPRKITAEALFIAMPFFNMFSYKLGTTSLFYLLIIVYCVRSLYSRTFQMPKKKLVVFLACCLFSLTIQDIAVWSKWALRFFLMVLLFKDESLEQSLENTMKYTSVSAILSSAVGYLMQVNGKSIYTRSYVYIQGMGSSTRFAGLIGDSVFYGQFIAVLIAVNLVLAYRNKQYGRFAHISSAIMAGFALLSISKTAILLIAVEVTVYVCFQVQKNAKRKKTVIKSVFLLAGVWIAILCLYGYVMTHPDNFIVKSFMTRFASKDLWTGRTSIAETYMKWLAGNWKYWISGMPFSQYTEGIQSGSLVIKRAHNIFIETACVFGVIPGMTMLVSLVVYFCRQWWRNKVSLINYLPLVILAASGVSLHGHFEWHFYFLCSIVFACAHSGIKKEESVIL